MNCYPPIGSQADIHANNISIGSWVTCPCEADRTRQREAGLPVAQFSLTGTLRIVKAEVFDGYGQVVETGDRIIYCTPVQAEHAKKLLAFHMFVTATLDARGNVVKVS